MDNEYMRMKKQYIKYRKRTRDSTWEEEQRLYISYKNKKYIAPLVFLSILTMFFRNGVVLIMLYWAWYYYKCCRNNAELDNSKEIQEKRIAYIDMRLNAYKENRRNNNE